MDYVSIRYSKGNLLSSLQPGYIINKAIMNEIEKEVILLKAVQEIIDEIINFGMFFLHGKGKDYNIEFKSTVHQKYFYIMVVDFLSRLEPKKIDCLKDLKFNNYLEGLIFVCENPQFNINNSIEYLKKPVNDMISWLEYEVIIEKLWLPLIEQEINLRIKRKDLIKISGNMSKHNFSRLDIVVKDLKGIFEENGVSLSCDDIITSLNSIYEWFHDDILNYYASVIAELLNNIRWGIHEYLKPTFEKCYKRTGNLQYEYKIPPEIKSELAKSCFWELMNVIKSGPIVEKFTATKYLKSRVKF